MRRSVAALVLVACSGHDAVPVEPAAPTPPRPPPAARGSAADSADPRAVEAAILAHALDADGHVPASLRRAPAPVALDKPLPRSNRDAGRWSIDARRQALAGAWLLHDRDDLRAFGFDGDRVRMWDGVKEDSRTLVLDQPCALSLQGERGAVEYALGLRDGVATFGTGTAGQLENGEAIVCALVTYHLERSGRCVYFTPEADAGEATRCARSGNTVWYRDRAFHETRTLAIAGDLLWDEQLAKTHAEPVTDYATAVALVTNQPAAVALRAGGHIGDTASVAGLVATVAGDRAGTMGRTVEVSGNVLDTGSSVLNGERTNYVDLNTAVDPFYPRVTCFTGAPPLGKLKPGEIAKVSGRVAALHAGGDVELRPCAIAPE